MRLLYTISILLSAFSLFAQSPGNVSTNLKLWLKASNATATGTNVSAWPDQSGGNNNATVITGTGGTVPQKIAAALNGNTVVRFDGIRALQGNFGTAVTSANTTAFIVFKMNSTGSQPFARAFSIAQAANTPAGDFNTTAGAMLFGRYNNGTNHIYCERNSVEFPSVNNVLDGPLLLSSSFSGNSFLFYRNGAQQSTTTFNATAFNAGAYAIGAGIDNGPSQFMNGDIAEVILYTTNLSAADRNKVESYLALKYGFTLDQTSPTNYTIDATTVWNAATNTGYTRNIVGIGRNDNSGLLQLQSQSSNIDGLLSVSASAFATNNTFFVAGDNGLPGTDINGSGSINFPYKSSRVWKAQVTNNVTGLSFTIDLNKAGLAQPTGGYSTSNVSLLISSSTSFGTATEVAPASVVNGVATFSNVTVADGSFMAIGLQNLAPTRGLIYIHKKALDENSSVPFTITVSGGPTTVGNITLNDQPETLDAYDLGASHGISGSNSGDGQLWAVAIFNNTGFPHSMSGTVYMRPVGSATWVSTGQTAINVDGAGYNEMVYTNANTAYFYTHGGAVNKIYDPANHGNVALRDIAWGGGMTVVIDANGRILRYTGTYANNSDSWVDLTTISGAPTSVFTIDVHPNTQTIVFQNSNGTVYTMQKDGTGFTTLPFPTGSVIAPVNSEVAVDDNGKIYANFKENGTFQQDFVYAYDAATNTWQFEAQTRLLKGLTGGAAGQMWASLNLKGTARGSIYSRTTEGGANWIDDERVRTTYPDNSAVLAVLPGTYTLTEIIPSGWDINEIWVKDPTSNSSGNAANNTASINVAAGEVVHVGFTNELVQAKTVVNSCSIVTQYLQTFGSGAAQFGPVQTGATPYHYVANTLPQDGYYTLEKNVNTWFSPGSQITTDHTPDATDGGNGYLLVVNASYGTDEFYRDRLKGLVVGQRYQMGFWAANISPTKPLKPNVTFGIANVNTGNFIGSVNTGAITSTTWKFYSFIFTATTATADIVFQNNSIGGEGNDIAIDDITVNAAPPTIGAVDGAAVMCSNNGSTYTMTNSTPGGVWSISPTTLAGINSSSGLVTPVFNATGSATITYTYTSVAGCVSIATKTVNIVNNCAALPVSLSGNVFNDADGQTDNTVNGPGTNAGGLNAIVYNNTTGRIQAVTAVAANGTYTFSNLPNGNDYSVIISTNSPVPGTTTARPAAVLPNNYVSTGENLGTDAGSDDNPDGVLRIGLLFVNISDVNFGIEQLSVADNVTAPTQANPVMNARVTVPTLTGSDAEDGIYTGVELTNTIIIQTLPPTNQAVLYYNGTAVTAGQTIAFYDPSLLKMDPIPNGAFSTSFTYSQVDAADKASPSATVSFSFTDDIDDDNDGITDINESGGYDPLADCDNDGIANYADPTPGCTTPSGNDPWGVPYKALTWSDCNNDGINDCFDFDRDGILNEMDLDSDNDGLLDVQEARPNGVAFSDALNGQITGGDDDNNGLLSSADNGNQNPVLNGIAAEDMDRDGTPNFLDMDSDGDGITDITEALSVYDNNGLINGTDTDGDGVRAEGFGNNTAAIADNIEGMGAKGLTLIDSDGDGYPDTYDIDSDNDGITDNVEGQPTCSMKVPLQSDCNGNGVDDAYDISACGACSRASAGITPFDFDNDNTPDYLDTDTDNDLVPDANEGSGRSGTFITDFSDVDHDGLIGQFDIFDITTATSLFGNNVGHSQMGNNGSTNGPFPAGSNARLPQAVAGNCPQDRDWRDQTVLPLTLLQFNGHRQGTAAILSWQVTNETGISYYAVERSTDGNRFSQAGTVAAANARDRVYTFTDAPATAYYRLRQVSRNGTVAYSPIVLLSGLNNGTPALSMYPNPAATYSVIRYQAMANTQGEIRLYNVSGQLMWTQPVNISKGPNAIALRHLGELPPGCYTVVLSTPQDMQQGKLLKK